MKRHFPAIGFALAMLLWAASSRAESLSDTVLMPSTRPSDSSTASVDSGAQPPFIEELPVDIRPFQLTLPQGHLLGDWLGARTQFVQMGITPTLSLEIDTAGNPTGGRSEGITEAGNLGLGVLFDLDKLTGIKGGSFLLQLSERWGNSLSADYIGNVFTTQQDFGGQTFHVVDAAYQQKLYDDRIEFRVGRIAAGDDFLVSPYDYLFMQNGLDGNPVGIFFDSPGMTAYPNATWGAVAKVRPTKRTYVMFGVYNGDSGIRTNDHNGADLSLHGPVFAMGEVGFKLNGLPGDGDLLGNYKAGAWYDNTEETEFGSTQTQRGSAGVYGLFDQVLIPFGETGSNRGLGVFGSALFSMDPSVAQMPFFYTGGVMARGLFPSRPMDSAGLGVVYGQFSHDLQIAQEQEMDPASLVQNHELALELTYRFSLYNNSMFFQPDLQYIAHPGGSGKYDDAVVLGCRLGANF
jgi:porin